MKYWRGYLVALIVTVISVSLTAFAKAHPALVDMIYPYMSRMVITALSEWSAGGSCIWQTALIMIAVLFVISIILMIVFRWNPIQWGGWVLAVVCTIFMLHNGLYGLNAFASPLADDMKLQITDYTVSELNEAAVYFRDQANALSKKVSRDGVGDVNFGTFETMADQAGDGFRSLTYDKAVSVFAGSTVPVKQQGFFRKNGVSGITVPLTGESCVNPNVPSVAMPFAICKEMAHRMCIYSEADGNFTAFLATVSNESVNFQYSGYLMAYYYCYEALSNIPTSTAQACAKQTHSGANQLVQNDLADCTAFYGTSAESKRQEHNIRTANTVATVEENSIVTFSEYASFTDLLASWYIQEYILPLHREEEAPFNPYDTTQVDISGLPNAPAAS